MTFEEYAAIDAVNWSTLKAMRQSPLHYRYRCDAPDADKPSFWMGRATHCAILEPDRFPLDFAVWEGDRRGKEYGAFKAANADRTILRSDEYAACLAMRDAVRGHPRAMRYIEHGKAEYVLTWTDEDTGLPMKCRIDFLSDLPALIDLKTTRDGDPRSFGYDAAKMGHPLQLALYSEGLRAHGVCTFPVRIIAVENVPPYDVGVLAVDDDMLYAASEQLRDLLRKVAACRASKSWPGRYAEEVPLELPSWWYGSEDLDTTLAGMGLVIEGEAV